ncbi:MAG: TlyA family RNA methyltransferase [Anaerolineae bacterium]|nr:TlyA family RNA methyltransferase [Anaerolineae bacterium]
MLCVVKTERLDRLVVQAGLVASRSIAQRLIMAGEVLVDGELADKPGMRIPTSAQIDLKAKPRFVSRGGEKLAAALERFGVAVAGRVVADIGASTGGFTDCLLQSGAARVYAIDVGYGQLAWKLRQDARVVVMERTNARYLSALPEPVSLVVSDVSFISLRLIYAAAVHWLAPNGDVVSLIKPQFEAGPANVGKGGVVRDPAVHRAVLEDVTKAMAGLNLGLRGLMPSPLKGPAGNIEFLGWWQVGTATPDRSAWIERALREAAAG